MSSKKWFKIISMLAVLSMLLVACAAPEPTKAPAPAATQAPAKPAEPTKAPAAVEPTKAPAPAATAATTAGGKKILRIAFHREADTLNPFTSQQTGEMFHPIFEGLTMSNEKNSYFAMIAKDIPTVENGGITKDAAGKTVMTWKLQENVKWHDGKEVTADDVCWTFNWIVSDDGAKIYNQQDYKNIEKCDVVDKFTAKFTWKVPFAKYGTLFEAVFPKHLLDGKVVSTLDSFNRAPVGNGPYKFGEWKAGQYLRLVKNENYWRGKDYAKFDEVVYTFIPDVNTRLNAMKAGEYDLTQLDPMLIKEAEGIPGMKAVMVSQNSFYHFDYSLKTERGKKLFSDIRVRQAIFYALDRESLAKDLFNGNVVVAHTPIHPTSPYFNKDVLKYNFDVEKSKKLLDDAGWKVGSDGIRAKDGEKLSFSILVSSGNKDRVLLAQAFQALLKKVNVDVKVEALDSLATTNKWRTGEWETVISGWILPADPSFTRQYQTGGSNNMTSTGDAELDKLMIASDEELAIDKRKDLSFKAQQKLAEVAYQLPIFYVTMPFVMRSDFVNFKPNGTNMTCYWNLYEWDIPSKK